MKILVTGVGGQLGHDVMNELARRGHQGVGSDIAPVYSGIADGSAVTEMPYVPMDITNDAQVRQVMDDVRPDAVIHCAAWTAVDLAEDADKQPKVRAINVDGTAHLAAACKAQDCKMMYISTDYVFNGQGQTPWQPDCKDYQPLNYYGETKLGGELAVSSALEKYFIVRIAWVFGLNGKNFIKTMPTLERRFLSNFLSVFLPPTITVSPTVRVPLCNGRSALRCCTKVLLPLPVCPIIPKKSPSSIVRETFFKASERNAVFLL